MAESTLTTWVHEGTPGKVIAIATYGIQLLD